LGAAEFEINAIKNGKKIELNAATPQSAQNVIRMRQINIFMRFM